MEHIFNSAGYVVSARRNRLGDKLPEKNCLLLSAVQNSCNIQVNKYAIVDPQQLMFSLSNSN